MSMFLCANCDNLRDSDDGCEEANDGRFGLICADCADQLQSEADEAADRERMINVGGHQDGRSAT